MNVNEFLDEVRRGLGTAGLSLGDKPRLLVAVSGGADSVALLRALLMLGCNCIVAHCNFHLRGDESDRDERFVRDLCCKLGVELHVQQFDANSEAKACGASVEMVCRQLRYQWFHELLVALHCSYVAVAHHADDNVETFFLNLLRGTGMRGLAGMKVRSDGVIRPMLSVTRQQVMNFLQQIGQDFVTDSTNLENDYKRNRIRNVVLPEIDKQFPGAIGRIVDTINHLSEERELFDSLCGICLRPDGFGQASDERGCYLFIPSDSLDYPPRGGALYEILRQDPALSFSHSQCNQAVKASVGARFYGGSYTLTVCRDGIEIQKDTGENREEIEMDLNEATDHSVFDITHGAEPFSKEMVDGKNRVALDHAVLGCKRVVLRHWRKGDRMRPYGMRGTKLISDLFVDLKLSPSQKKAIWLLEADGKILWVLGHRAAHEFVVQPGSTGYVVLSFNG